ncbi:MAG: hypothetical protein ACFN27_06085 [Prevotella sp.]
MKYIITSRKSPYISPSCELLSMDPFNFFCTSAQPSTTGSTEPGFKDEEGVDWGEIEF